MTEMEESRVNKSETEEEEEEEDDYIRLFSHSGQFFLEEPYIYLINPDLFPERVSYIREFKMKEILLPLVSLKRK
ncbi:MAG: hypothetical protein ACW964_15615 [Candidatus Hodarchaeales archaeon]|jgi:hypothetical protein